jgi:hypothetical protein
MAEAKDDSVLQALLSEYSRTSALKPDFDELFTGLAEMARGAQGEAQSARGAYETARQQPPATTPPLADLVARSMGQLASDLTGRQSPRDLAESTIKREQTMLHLRQTEELERLAMAYGKAADRAGRLGDTEMELKLRERLSQRREQTQEKLNILRLSISEHLADKREMGAAARSGAANTAAHTRAMDLENLRFQHALGIESFRISSGRYGSTAQNLPPELKASLQPTLERMTQLSQAVGSIRANPKLRMNQQKERIDKLNAEYSDLEGQYQESIARYFQQPAGDTGAAAQTPLGEVMDALKSAGATTLEDARRIIFAQNELPAAHKHGFSPQKLFTAAKVIFPREAEVNRTLKEYRGLTSGPLFMSKIRQNRARINDLAAMLNRWGHIAKTSEELLAPPEPITLPEIVVR